MRTLALLVALVSAGLVPASVSATKPTPVVPSFIQKLIRAKAGPLAAVPTRVPLRYRYVRYRWDGAGRVLTFTLADRRFPVDGRRSITFTVRRFGGAPATCGGGREKTLQMGGNKVYWDGSLAWRCVLARDGRLIRVAAEGPNLPDVALGRLVASAKRVS